MATDFKDEQEIAQGNAEPSFIVGLGASAGGLEALEKFFASVDVDTQMAFVVVQHLSPNFKTMMDELLRRKTLLPIKMVTQEMVVEPGHVYLLPPRKQMIISGGRLLVADKDHQGDFFLPIDHFFRSLGQDQNRRSVGIILSGTGSDGSRGIEHIHRAGGLVLVQTEDSAAFDGMPRAAQNTGLVDLVVLPQDMPTILDKYASSPSDWRVKNENATDLATDPASGLNSIVSLLKSQYGIDFSFYKPDMLARRIERRLLLGASLDIADYVNKLDGDSEELANIYQDMLIGVTGFFRDPEAYKHLEKELLPSLLANLEPDQEFRVWVAATATGEEAYSIAILVDEYFTKHNLQVRCRIFATDVHQASLDFASKGLYSENRVRDLSPERLKNYFQKEATGYRVSAAIRQLVVFAPHNVITDAPFTNLNLVTCRNLLIYLKPDVQHRVLTLFHFSLAVGGGLWLGSSEVPTQLEEEFETVHSQWKQYTKKRDIRLTSRLRVPSTAPSTLTRRTEVQTAAKTDSRLLATYDTILDIFMPPSMLISEGRQLLQSFNGASRFIKPTDGRISSDILDQLEAPLRMPLSTALRRVQREKKPFELGGIKYTTDHGPRLLSMAVRPIKAKNGPETSYLIEFRIDEESNVPAASQEEVDAEAASSEHAAALERELAFVRQTLNTTIEELQVANEEMQSTNEELVASNEELQSTNEELHSVNEELYTVNAEYQRKIAELTELTDDMDNLLNSTHVDTIFLDRQLKVRKFTPNVAEKFNLLRQDIGRNFESFTYRLDDDDLLDELRQVLRTEQIFEREVCDRAARTYLMRILPYISRGHVEGVVLTLVDITRLNEAQSRLAELSEIVQQSNDAIFRVDRDGLIRSWNDGAKRIYGHSNDIIGRPFATLFPDSMHNQLDEMLGNLANVSDVSVIEPHKIARGNELIDIACTISPVLDNNGKIVAASVVARDVTDRLRAENEIRESIERRDQFLAMLSHELRNPLGAIVNAARVIQGAQQEEARNRASEVVIRQSGQMARLLDDLLDVSRITLGKIELKKQIFDLRETIEEAVKVIGPVFVEQCVHFEYEVGQEPLFVDGDPVRLQQVVVNLLRNAAKYTQSDGNARLTALRDKQEIEIRIKDNGVGIDNDMLEKVFGMFVQVNSSLERSQGGIGLGLTLVQAVVSMHAGTVEVFSEGMGKGSEFRVRLPLSQTPPKSTTRRTLPNQVRSIVIVEDIPDAREMLEGLLTMQGYTVQSASDGVAGLELIKEFMPDVALIDIGLPRMDGYEIARALRSNPETASLFLVALTGYGQSSDQAAVSDAGFDKHLVKPLNMDELNHLLSGR